MVIYEMPPVESCSKGCPSPSMKKGASLPPPPEGDIVDCLELRMSSSGGGGSKALFFGDGGGPRWTIPEKPKNRSGEFGDLRNATGGELLEGVSSPVNEERRFIATPSKGGHCRLPGVSEYPPPEGVDSKRFSLKMGEDYGGSSQDKRKKRSGEFGDLRNATGGELLEGVSSPVNEERHFIATPSGGGHCRLPGVANVLLWRRWLQSAFL